MCPLRITLVMISLCFFANDGQLDSNLATVTLRIAPVNDPPVVSIQSPSSGLEGTAINLVGSASDLETSNELLSFQWGITKDGLAYRSGSTKDYSFTPDDNGVYVVTLTVTDEAGASASSSQTILVITSRRLSHWTTFQFPALRDQR